ncbi:cation:proton antiporter [Streptomyces uncialis]|uniref:Cation transporter n=1 Tax=Streptomyces uncialis TaxID=1048205 RepID=A0A1Q4V8E3_9ACTN|nr:cation:proton antiporter [Streptomyces uncialis]OKH94029.1 cation transporter [Streptomyces uncialis]WTE09116.1 cation:proton antiporter [Streptomyces uncialis]
MTPSDIVYTTLGLGALAAAVLPRLLRRRPLSMPIVFLVIGAVAAALPVPLPQVDPVADRVWVEHVTEVCVIVSLMGAGLAINRPFTPRSWAGPWRLIGITLPLTVVATAMSAWLLLGWPVAAALLAGALLAPTDPVLAAEVRVGEPTDDENDEDEVRFALTAEAGLNDGLAFPFVLAAVALAAAGGAWSQAGWGRWFVVDVLVKVAVGVVVGLALGRLLGWMFFRAGASALRLSGHMEGFVALAATFLSYGIAELAHGYGFLAVFVTACTIRAAERDHGYHKVLHEFTEQIERLLTAALLVLLGGYLVTGGLSELTWWTVLVALGLILVIRPVTGWIAQLGLPAGPRERAVTAVFGLRGIGSLFYLSYALGHDDFAGLAEELWALTALTVALSVLLHGVSATPVIRRLDQLRGTRPTDTPP